MDRTKYYKRGYIMLFILDILLTFGPIVGFLIYGWCVAETAVKVVLGIISVTGIVLAVLAALSKYTFRGAIFIILFGLYLAIGEITWILLIIGICTIMDEVLINPLLKHYKEKYSINKEMDIREYEREN